MADTKPSEYSRFFGYKYSHFGQDGYGHDLKVFGNTSGKYMHWDSSNNKLNITGKLTSLNINYTLDDFDGDTDVEKLQNAVDLSITQDVEIVLNRDVDLTGESINIDKGYANFLTISSINNASLIKEDDGFMFTSSYDNINRGNIRFNGICFYGDIDYEPYVCDMNRMIQIFFNDCKFKDCNAVSATIRYSQTLRIFNCSIYNHKGYFLNAVKFYDCQINNNQIESCGVGNFMKAGSATYSGACLINFGFRDNLLEGQTNVCFEFSNTFYSAQITNNYFEANLSGIIDIFNSTSSTKNISLDFSNNFVSSNTSAINCINNLKYLGPLSKISLKDNFLTSDNCYFLDTNGVTEKIKIHAINNTSSNASLDVDYLVTDQFTPIEIITGSNENHGSAFTASYAAGTGVTIEIDNFFVGENTKYAGKSMLVSISTKETSRYISNYLGILSIVGEDDTGDIIRMYLTDLFDKIGGTTPSNSMGVSATFGNATDSESNNDTVLTNKKLIFVLANCIDDENLEISIKPFDELLTTQSTELFKREYDSFS